MELSELHKTLQTLHAELSLAESVDPATREMLSTLAADIQRLSDQSSCDASEELEPLSARVQEMVLKFETDHPKLTHALDQVSTALANLGI